MRSQTLLFFFLFISLSSTITALNISLSPPQPKPKPRTLIQKTCEKCSATDPNVQYDFCAMSLCSSPDSHRYSTNLRQLGLLPIRLTKQNATSTSLFINRLLVNGKKKKLDPYVRACLQDCLELYEDATQTIKEVATEYKERLYDDAGFAMSSVIDAAATCEGCFGDRVEEKKVYVSPLTKRNSDLSQLAIISLSIINMLNVG